MVSCKKFISIPIQASQRSPECSCGRQEASHLNSILYHISCNMHYLYAVVYTTYWSIYLSVYPILLGTVGAPHDLATNSRHSSRSSALLMASLSSNPVQSRMLSSHRFLCLPLLLPPRTVPWRTVLASLKALVTCPYHFILSLFTVDKSSS